jgi:hypothetical protein
VSDLARAYIRDDSAHVEGRERHPTHRSRRTHTTRPAHASAAPPTACPAKPPHPRRRPGGRTRWRHAHHRKDDERYMTSVQTSGSDESFHREAGEPVTSEADAARAADWTRLRSAAERSNSIEILGPPPFSAPAPASTADPRARLSEPALTREETAAAPSATRYCPQLRGAGSTPESAGFRRTRPVEERFFVPVDSRCRVRRPANFDLPLERAGRAGTRGSIWAMNLGRARTGRRPAQEGRPFRPKRRRRRRLGTGGEATPLMIRGISKTFCDRFELAGHIAGTRGVGFSVEDSQ